MSHWAGSKGDPKGFNKKNPADPYCESDHAEFKHGNFSNTAKVVSKEEQLAEEGSRGLDIDQGGVDTAIAIQPAQGHIGQKIGRIKTEKQGSHAHLGNLGERKTRERKNLV